MEIQLTSFLEEYISDLPASMQEGKIQKLTYSDNLTKISLLNFS